MWAVSGKQAFLPVLSKFHRFNSLLTGRSSRAKPSGLVHQYKNRWAAVFRTQKGEGGLAPQQMVIIILLAVIMILLIVFIKKMEGRL